MSLETAVPHLYNKIAFWEGWIAWTFGVEDEEAWHS
jgi:hypothetical protein